MEGSQFKINTFISQPSKYKDFIAFSGRSLCKDFHR